MALIVEDGTGLSTAEAYASVESADEYGSKYGMPDEWSAGTAENKEQWLRKGARYLDLKYGRRWLGRRANEAQRLDWPRCEVEDYDGYTLDDESIPEGVERANILAAFSVAQGDDLMPAIEKPGSLRKKFIKVGPLAVSKQWQGGESQFKRYTEIEAELSTLIIPGSYVERG